MEYLWLLVGAFSCTAHSFDLLSWGACGIASSRSRYSLAQVTAMTVMAMTVVVIEGEEILVEEPFSGWPILIEIICDRICEKGPF